MAGAGIGGDPNQGTQHLVIGQNMVVAINGIANAINTKFPDWVTVPANSSASGVAGQVAYSGSATTTAFLYVCLANGVWGRTTLTTSF